MGGEIDAERIRRELMLAEESRRGGREGRARVCARRAAGWSVARYYRTVTGGAPPPNVVVLLRWYRDLPGAPQSLREAAHRLSIPVTEDHRLPHDEDPLEDARRLAGALVEDLDLNAA